MSKETSEDGLRSRLASEQKENERLRGRQQELRSLIAKLTRETPYPAELDECRSARAALIVERRPHFGQHGSKRPHLCYELIDALLEVK